MKKILFVCMGNICRSPAAEGIMKELIKTENLESKIYVDSAGTINFHEGELPDKRMRQAAKNRGYILDSTSRPFNRKVDFDYFDYIITMDDHNYKMIIDWDKEKKYSDKVYKMKDFFTNKNLNEVPDPYYGENKEFENVLNILEDATKNLLSKIKEDIGKDTIK